MFRELRHRQVGVENVSLHVVEGGDPLRSRGSVLFLHGWPESWAAYEQTMLQLADSMHVVAIDLPGVGWSEGKVAAYDKLTLARYVKGAIDALGLQNVTLVGHDVGAQIAYATLRAYSGLLSKAAIMNAVIPGVAPWDAVVSNPHIWHFGFHAVPELPEKLVSPQAAEYFAYFYDTLGGPAGVSDKLRHQFVKAYARPSALHAGFEWYRALEQDAKDNRAAQSVPVRTPVLYVRGEREPVELDVYLKGLTAAGLEHVEGAIIPDAGHFIPAEQPLELAALIRQFTASR